MKLSSQRSVAHCVLYDCFGAFYPEAELAAVPLRVDRFTVAVGALARMELVCIAHSQAVALC
jgi:hypothetical protein